MFTYAELWANRENRLDIARRDVEVDQYERFRRRTPVEQLQYLQNELAEHEKWLPVHAAS